MSDKYILDGHTPKAVAGTREWAEWFEVADRRVARTVIGDVTVSTMFLGINHQWSDGPPLLFETMIFGGPNDEWQERCSTWEEAEAMHERAVSLVRSTLQ